MILEVPEISGGWGKWKDFHGVRVVSRVGLSYGRINLVETPLNPTIRQDTHCKTSGTKKRVHASQDSLINLKRSLWT